MFGILNCLVFLPLLPLPSIASSFLLESATIFLVIPWFLNLSRSGVGLFGAWMGDCLKSPCESVHPAHLDEEVCVCKILDICMAGM